MMFKIVPTVILSVLFLAPFVQAESVSPTRTVVQELRLGSVLDFNRTLGVSADLSLEYSLLIHSHFKTAVGISADLGKGSLAGYYLQAGAEAWPWKFFSFRAKWLNTTYSASLRSLNSLALTAEAKASVFYIEVGAALRYWNADPILYPSILSATGSAVEPGLVYEMGLRFKPVAGVYDLVFSLANADRFSLGNVGTFRLFVRNEFHFFKWMSVDAELGMEPAGNIALTGNSHHYYFGVGFGGRL